MTTVTRPRGLRVPTRVRFPRLTLRRGVALLALALLLLAAWLYVRSSGLVAIRQVQVTGLAGAEAGEIRAALADEAVTMTTLDVSTAKLEGAVANFPHIAGVHVITHFPHAVTIVVDEQTPVATVTSGGRAVAVDAAGLLLPHDATAGLPSLPLAPDTGTNHVTSSGTLATLAVLRAAPYQLLSHIASARPSSRHGITVQLRKGPVLYFGDTSQLAAKWSAASAVLASPDSAGASYIDISAPGRPAAGTGN